MTYIDAMGVDLFTIFNPKVETPLPKKGQFLIDYYKQSLTPYMTEIILNAAERTPGLKKLILFGSRATATHKVGSDIDLAFERDPAAFKAPGILWYILEESFLPVLFDLVDLTEPINPALRKEIEKEGVVIWERGTEKVG
jgi:uncharacterized protein